MRIVIKSFWLTTVITLIALALVMSLARITLPVISEYKGDIETLLAKNLGHPLSIGSIEAQMQGFSPSLHLLNVSMLDRSTAEPLLFFNDIRIEIDALASLRNWRPEFGSLTLSGLNLAIERTQEGKFLIAGVQGGGEQKAQLGSSQDDIVDWFFSKDHLVIEQTTLRWTDRMLDLPEWVFSDINFSLVNEGNRHQFVGHGFFPQQLGKQFNFSFDAHHDDGENIAGRGYIKTAGVELLPLQPYVYTDAPGYTIEGQFDVASWFTLDAGEFTRIDTNIKSQQLVFSAPDVAALSLNDIDTTLHWQSEENGWRLGLEHLDARQGEASWVIKNAGVRYQNQEQHRKYEVEAQHLQMASLAELVQRLPVLDKDTKQMLLAMKPQATADDFYLRWLGGGGKTEDMFARSRLSDVDISAYKKIPGVSGIDGELFFDQQQWVLNLATQDAHLDFVSMGLFRDAFHVEELRGTLVGKHEENNWEVKSEHLSFSNQHLSASAYLTLQQLTPDISPELDLVVSVDRADGRYTSHYLPVGIMRERVVKWLDRSIVGATVRSAGVAFRGPLKSFPFDSLDGRFEVQVDFKGGVLSYWPGWPPIVDIDGQLIFNEQTMEVIGRSAMTLDSKLTDVRVGIPKFRSKNRALYIKGHAAGPASNGILFLTTTPLEKTIGKHFQSTKAQGQSELDLSLRIPLNERESGVSIEGDVSFSESDLFFQDLGIDITHVNGLLSFTEKGVNAKNLRGRVLGFQTEASLTSEAQQQGIDVVIEAQGMASPDALLQRFHVPVFKSLTGDVSWQGRLRLPASGHPQLTLHSNLEGVAVNIPAPLGKPASQARSLDVAMTFPFNEKHPLRLSYGEHLQGVFELEAEEKGFVARRGELRYREGIAQLPQGKGLRLVGYLDVYDHGEWMDYMSTWADGEGDDGGADFSLAEVEARFDEGLFYGLNAQHVSLQLVEAQEGYLGEVFSAEVAGHFVIPNAADEPIAMEMDYLFYASEEVEDANAETQSKPQEIRPLQLNVGSLYRDGALLGGLAFSMTPHVDDVNALKIDIVGPHLDMALTGHWVQREGAQQTAIQGRIDSQNAGHLLETLGFLDNLKDGQAKTSLDVQWPGGIGAFALDKLVGKMKFDVKSGTLRDVDPGAGRIFGLLSVQALPRRLSLDFSDLFLEGLAFDKIKGVVEFNQGEAFTDNLLLTGPSADISITGYIDLIGKKYNQYVTVEPNLTGTLPLAVAVIANPVAGVAAWFAEKLLKKPVSGIAKILYHVSGSWDEPEVKQLGRLDYYRQQEEMLAR